LFRYLLRHQEEEGEERRVQEKIRSVEDLIKRVYYEKVIDIIEEVWYLLIPTIAGRLSIVASPKRPIILSSK
jgi:hypothetical protein